MVDCLIFIFSIFIPCLLGAFVLFFIKKTRVVDTLFLILSFGLGTGILSFLMFGWGLAKWPFSYFVYLIFILSILCLFFLVFHLKGFSFKFLRPRFNYLGLILILIIVFEVLFVFLASGWRAESDFDALANWAWKAKVFFLEPGKAFSPSAELFLGVTQKNYPLHVPLFITWTYLWQGRVNDSLMSLIFSFYFLALIVFVYLSLRSLIKSIPVKSDIQRKLPLALTAVLATLPLLNYHGTIAYADLTLTFYFTLAAICLFNFFKNKENSDLILAGLFSGLAAWTKNEGLMLFGALLIVFLLYWWKSGFRRGLTSVKSLFVFISCFLIFHLPWLIFKLIQGFGYNSINYQGGIGFVGFHPEVLGPFLRQIFVFNSFHLWPGIFILLLIILHKKIFISPNYYLLLIILAVAAGYLALYLFTPSYQYVIIGTVVGRNFLTLMPISVFLAGLIATEL